MFIATTEGLSFKDKENYITRESDVRLARQYIKEIHAAPGASSACDVVFDTCGNLGSAIRRADQRNNYGRRRFSRRSFRAYKGKLQQSSKRYAGSTYRR